MRVIITGGTGLIGRALAASMAADGHEVIVLSRDPGRVRGLPPGVVAAGWDAATARGWGHMADGAGAIVNLAGENLGEGRWTAKRKARIVESRVNAGHAVVEAIKAAKQKPSVLIQPSGVGYYGPHGDEPVDENTAPGQDWQASVCLQWEASTAEAESLGVRRVVTRTGVVLMRRGGALPRMLLPYRFFVGGPVGSGRQWLSWLHLADEVSAIRFLIDCASASGVFNVAAPEPVNFRTLARTIGRVMRRPALMPVPAFAMRLLFGEMSATVLQGQRVISPRLQALDFTFRYPTLESALRDLTA